MYIYDCLYGKIEFNKKILRCMLTPEMQRLREVRLGNINSLCLTSSANINRYEHSVGTAYLALVNERANKGKFGKENKDVFVYAALFHDLANGPFGHAYEYIVQKQGFIPEDSIGDVILGKMSGSHKKGSKLEPFYLGEPNEIGTVLNRQEIEALDEIVRGENVECSKILSDVIDIDNIDNVYRMAYHMGISIDKRIPIELAKGIVCEKNTIYFKDYVIPYLYDWYEVRSKVYKLLLYNPQDFAAKCMMTDVMDAVLEKEPSIIKWQYTDYELIEVLRGMKEEYWDDIYVPIMYIDANSLDAIGEKLSDKNEARKYLEELGISVPTNAKINVSAKDDEIFVEFYNTEYCFTKECVYKKTRMCMNPSRIINRLMRGDLFACVGIYVSSNVKLYDVFSDYKKRRVIEMECNQYIEKALGEREFSVAFHAIVDKNKTNRQLEINIESGECLTIGHNTNEILIGAFLRNASYGIAKTGGFSEQKRKKVSGVVKAFLEFKGIECIEHKLYSEVECIGEDGD